MKAQRERRAGAAGQLVFAAQIVAVRREVKLARIGHAKTRAIAVMGGCDPLMPAILGALAAHRARSPAERAVSPDLDSVDITDDHHRMRRARPRDAAPGRLGAAISAAIDDDPLAPLAQLEGEGSGMRLAVEAARRRLAGIDDDQALPGLQALKTGLRRRHWRMAPRLRAGQGEIDDDAILLDRVVEQRETAIAMAKKPQHRRHALDRLLQWDGDVDLRRTQHRADVDQVTQHRELDRGTARAVAAIG